MPPVAAAPDEVEEKTDTTLEKPDAPDNAQKQPDANSGGWSAGAPPEQAQPSPQPDTSQPLKGADPDADNYSVVHAETPPDQAAAPAADRGPGAPPVQPWHEDDADARHQDVYRTVDKQMSDKFNQEHPFAPSGWQPETPPEVYDQAVRQSDKEAQAELREKDSSLEAQMRGTGQKYYRDADGTVQPVIDQETGKPLYETTAREQGINPDTKQPSWVKRDKYGQKQYETPALVSNPTDPTDKKLYYNFGDGKQVPAGNIDDLVKSKDFKVARTAIKARNQQRAQVWKDAIAPMQDVLAQTNEQFDNAKSQSLELGTKAEQLKSQIAAIDQNPQASETTGGVMGFGGSPSDAATQLQSQRAQLSNQLDQITKQGADLDSQTKPGGALWKQQRDAKLHLSVFKAKAAHDNYADLADERRAILKEKGLPEAGDTILQSIKDAQTAYGQGIEKYGAQADQNAQAAATPTAAAQPTEAGVSQEPYQLAAQGIKGIGGVSVQALARNYGSGNGDVTPASLVKMSQRISDIKSQLADKQTSEPVKAGIQKESDYLSSLYAQRLTKLSPDDQKKVTDVVSSQKIGTISDLARRFVRGIPEGAGQAVKGTGGFGAEIEHLITRPILTHFLAKARNKDGTPLTDNQRQAATEVLSNVMDHVMAKQGGLAGLPFAAQEVGRRAKDFANKIAVNPTREGKPGTGIAEMGGQLVGALPAAAAGPVGGILAGSGMMRDQAHDAAISQGDSEDVAKAKGDMAAFAGGVLGLIPGAKGAGGLVEKAGLKGAAATVAKVGLKSAEGAGLNAAQDVALQKASTGKIDWQEAGQQAKFGGIFAGLFSLPDEYRGRAQARIEEIAKNRAVDAKTAELVVAQERAKAQAAGASLKAPEEPAAPAAAETPVVQPEKKSAAESAKVFEPALKEGRIPPAKEAAESAAVFNREAQADKLVDKVASASGQPKDEILKQRGDKTVDEWTQHLQKEEAYHKNPLIENPERRSTELRAQLEKANADWQDRIAELGKQREGHEAAAGQQKTEELQQRRDAIEKELTTSERLRQSPKGLELLRNELKEGEGGEETPGTTAEKPPIKPIAPEGVAKMGAKEFTDYTKTLADKGGMTGEAHRAGVAAKGDEQAIGQFDESHQQAVADAKEAMKAGKIDDALALAAKAQFFREAKEAATGTGSAGEHFAENPISSPSASQGDKTQPETPPTREPGPTAKELKPLPEGTKVRHYAKKSAVIEGQGEPVDHWLVKMPGETKARALTAEALAAEGFKAPEVTEAPANKHGEIEGDKINKEWTQFSPESKGLGVPRSEMPQVKAEHRGALVNFLKGQGVESKAQLVRPTDLKPSQNEYSQDKVEKARNFEGGERSILVSSDNHVIDGHHQWAAALHDEPMKPMKVIKIDAPAKNLIEKMKEFPSAETAAGATKTTEDKSNAVSQQGSGKMDVGKPPENGKGVGGKNPIDQGAAGARQEKAGAEAVSKGVGKPFEDMLLATHGAINSLPKDSLIRRSLEVSAQIAHAAKPEQEIHALRVLSEGAGKAAAEIRRVNPERESAAKALEDARDQAIETLRKSKEAPTKEDAQKQAQADADKNYKLASKEYTRAQQAYRARTIGDKEFLSARKRFEDAKKALDNPVVAVNKPKGRSFSVGSHPSGGEDILNAIEEQGGIKSGSTETGGEHDDIKSTFQGRAKLLLRKTGSSPDQMAQELHQMGMIKDSDVGTMNAAVEKALRDRTSSTKTLKAQEENDRFERAFLGNEHGKKYLRAMQSVSIDDLKVGDEFSVNGDKFKVIDINPDNGAVKIKDGVTKEIPAGTPVYPDEGKVKKVSRKVDFLDKETEESNAAKETPKETPKEPKGDLFSESEMPFNLAGEEQHAPAAKAESAEPTPAQGEMFHIEQIVKEQDPVKSANAAQELYGDPAQAADRLEKQLATFDSDPANKKNFDKDQRARLKEVVSLLRQRATENPKPTGNSPAPSVRISDKLISGLDALRIHKPGMISAGTPFSLAWDSAIDTAILAIKTGRAVGDAVKFGIARLKEKFPNATDEHLAKFESAIRGVYDKQPEAKPAAETTPEKPAGTTGIAHRVSEARGIAAERGEGISTPDSIQKGRELLKNGYDVQKAVDDFQKTKAVSSDLMAAFRAHEEVLSKAVQKAQKEHGANSPEAKAAWDADKKWLETGKEMQTEWHKTGQAQQGETEIDTGTFHGLQKAYFEASGKDFTKEQADKATKIADGVKGATDEANAAQEKVLKTAGVEKATGDSVQKATAKVKARKPGTPWKPDEAKALWHLAKANYLDKGTEDINDIRAGLATDLGLSKNEIFQGLAAPKGVRQITNDMYAKMAARRRVIQQAKQWVAEAKYPGYEKFFRAIPGAFFNLATFGHGTVWTITHAGNQYFLPKATGELFKDLGRSFKLMGVRDKGAYHLRMMEDLVRDPNYVTAKRAGLANDPFKYQDDYQNAGVVKVFKNIGLMGNRGFDGMKLFRQFRFNQEWGNTPESLKTPEYAKLLADRLNKATGISKASKLPNWMNTVFFAPKLEMSRWAFLYSDPVKDSLTIAKGLANKDSVTPEAYRNATRDMRQKVTMAGAYLGALALNQALLSATGSKQSINLGNPRAGDWLNFKGFGHNFGVVSPMINSIRFLQNIAHDFWGERSKLEQLQATRGSEAVERAGEYARGKLSPFANVALDAASQSDALGRPMPWSSDPLSYRAKQIGETSRYGYGEYASKKLLPIPMEEAATEIWKSQGATDEQVSKWLRAIAIGVAAGGTGVRVTNDTSGDYIPRGAKKGKSPVSANN